MTESQCASACTPQRWSVLWFNLRLYLGACYLRGSKTPLPIYRATFVCHPFHLLHAFSLVLVVGGRHFATLILPHFSVLVLIDPPGSPHSVALSSVWLRSRVLVLALVPVFFLSLPWPYCFFLFGLADPGLCRAQSNSKLNSNQLN